MDVLIAVSMVYRVYPLGDKEAIDVVNRRIKCSGYSPIPEWVIQSVHKKLIVLSLGTVLPSGRQSASSSLHACSRDRNDVTKAAVHPGNNMKIESQVTEIIYDRILVSKYLSIQDAVTIIYDDDDI